MKPTTTGRFTIHDSAGHRFRVIVRIVGGMLVCYCPETDHEIDMNDIAENEYTWKKGWI